MQVDGAAEGIAALQRRQAPGERSSGDFRALQGGDDGKEINWRARERIEAAQEQRKEIFVGPL